MSAMGGHASDTGASPTGASPTGASPTEEERASGRSFTGGRGPAPRARAGHQARRLGVTAAVVAAVAIAGIAGAVATASSSASTLPGARLTGVVAPAAGGDSPGTAWAYAAPVMIGHAVVVNPSSASAPLALTAQDRKDCPAAAAACVDLARHITWLQSDGRVTFGPVRMEPGKPGSGPHATPAGTFHVQWKAGPDFVSDIYNEPMPWATFFAPGGVAFHGGSLTHWSHGCVHLTVANAHYYNENLPIGAEVVVF